MRETIASGAADRCWADVDAPVGFALLKPIGIVTGWFLVVTACAVVASGCCTMRYGAVPRIPVWAEPLFDDPLGRESGDGGWARAVRDHGTGIVMLLVPYGEMTFGDDAAFYPDEKPARRVRISRPFYLGRTEVTCLEWRRAMGAPEATASATSRPTPTSRPSEGRTTATDIDGRDAYPMTRVSRDDIEGFLRTSGFRLPTEAEWEYAARAGRRTVPTDVPANTWSAANSGGHTHAVATATPNPWGFHDLVGNVWEWCDDGYDVSLYRDLKDGAVDPRGPADAPKIAQRGGSAFDMPARVRWTSRASGLRNDRQDALGFRVARDVVGENDRDPASRPAESRPVAVIESLTATDNKRMLRLARECALGGNR